RPSAGSRAWTPRGSTRRARRRSRRPGPFLSRATRGTKPMRRGAAFHAQADARRSIAAAAAARGAVPEVAAFTRAVPVLAKPILLRLGVELHRALREVFALPGLDRRR